MRITGVRVTATYNQVEVGTVELNQNEDHIRINLSGGSRSTVIHNFLGKVESGHVLGSLELDTLTLPTASDSGLVDHAWRELSLTEEDQDFKWAVMKVVNAFASYGHSESSAMAMLGCLEQLIRFRNLTPLTNNPAEWNEVTDELWQSSRRSEAFSHDVGHTYYLVSEVDQEHQEDKTMYTSKEWDRPEDDSVVIPENGEEVSDGPEA